MINTAGSVIAYFIPIGLLLVAWAGLPPARARHAAASGLMAACLAIVAYSLCGFAFEFGGLGFVTPQPGYESLRGLYSPLAQGDAGWGVIGLRGFLLDGGAPSPEVAGLFLHHLPLVITAALIPCLALASRLRYAVLAILALFIAGLVYPLAGHWIVGGGWLASLGVHLQVGHGVVDYAGAGPVYLLGGLTALVGLFVSGSRPAREPPAGLPPAYFPLMAAAGGIVYGLGWMAWVSSDPLHAADPTLNLPLAMVNGLVAAAAATVISQIYSWLATARIDLLMSARGWLAGWIIVSAGAPFIATWTALVLGALAGLWLPLGMWIVERVLRRDDSTALVSLCGLIGAWAVLVPGAFADGNWGAGWNGVGPDEYLTVTGQGLTGLFVSSGFAADPGQFTAQLVELVVLACLATFAAWSVFGAWRGVLGARAAGSPVPEDVPA